MREDSFTQRYITHLKLDTVHTKHCYHIMVFLIDLEYVKVKKDALLIIFVWIKWI